MNNQTSSVLVLTNDIKYFNIANQKLSERLFLVYLATTAKDVINKIEANYIDFILIDSIDGSKTELIHYLRNSEKCQNIKVVELDALAEEFANDVQIIA